MAMSESQFEQTSELLEGDIRTLFKLVVTHRTPVTEGDIRAASAILRRWLCERIIDRLCHEAGATPTFAVLDNLQIINAVAAEPAVNYFLTGGVRFNGVPIRGIFHSAEAPSDRLSLAIAGARRVLVNTSTFLNQKRVVFEGSYFTCEDIIKFTANKLGGVHLDFKREDRKEIMSRAADYMTFGGPLDRINREPPGEIYQVLEPKGTEVLSGFHLEILAAAASFLSLHLDGQPFVEFKTKRNTWRRLTKSLLKRRHSILIYGHKNLRDP